MNSNQLRCIINCDHELRHFISGVFARDQIPQYINQSFCGFISNTDKSQDKGQHWVAFYVPSSTTGFFFDSYGITQLSMPRNLKTFSPETVWRFSTTTSVYKAITPTCVVILFVYIFYYNLATYRSSKCYACSTNTILAMIFSCTTSYTMPSPIVWTMTRSVSCVLQVCFIYHP